MPPKAGKKNTPKTKQKKKIETDSSEAEVEEREEKREEKKKSQKSKSKDDEIEIIPIIYDITDSEHPLIHLNRKPASVDISKICEKLDREEVISYL